MSRPSANHHWFRRQTWQRCLQDLQSPFFDQGMTIPFYPFTFTGECVCPTSGHMPASAGRLAKSYCLLLVPHMKKDQSVSHACNFWGISNTLRNSSPNNGISIYVTRQTLWEIRASQSFLGLEMSNNKGGNRSKARGEMGYSSHVPPVPVNNVEEFNS